MQKLIDYLNEGSEEKTEKFIEESYYMLTTLSSIYPIIRREQPLRSVGHLCMFTINTVFLLSAAYFIVMTCISLSKVNFVLLVNEVHLNCLVVMCLPMLFHSWFKRSTTADIHRIIATGFFDYGEDLSWTYDVLRRKMAEERRFYLFGVAMIAFAASSVILLSTELNRYGTFDFSTVHDVNLDLLMPFGYPFMAKDPVGLALENAYIIILGSIFTLINCSKSFMMIECTLQIQLQLRLLIIQLIEAERRAEKLYLESYGSSPNGLNVHSIKFSECYEKCIIKCIQHYGVISRATNMVSKISGLYVFTYYLFAPINIAMSMLSITSFSELPGTSFTATVMCVVEIGFVALFANLGQGITDLSVELRDVIYGLRWYRFDRRVKHTVRMFLIATLKPLSLSFYSLLNINYDSFATVLNSSYSIYNLINASQK